MKTEDDEVTESDSRDQAYGIGRILAISDGVFAFALTLLVVELVVPVASTRSSLASQLLDQWPTYFSYVLSFTTIAFTWAGHHESFRHMRRYNGGLIAINFVTLLLVALLPFPTAVIGRNGGDPLAAAIYATALGLTSLSSAVTWWYARGSRLVRRDLEPQISRSRYLWTLTNAAVFLLSVPVALWKPYVAEVSWGLVTTISGLFRFVIVRGR